MGDENNGADLAAQRQFRVQPQKQYNINITDHSDRSSWWPSLLSWSDGRWPATVADTIAVVLSVAVAWCLLLVNVSPALMAVPGGSVASIFMLYVAGLAAGHAVDVVGGLPPLLGMMVAGIALQNVGLYTVTASWCVQLVAIMR